MKKRKLFSISTFLLAGLTPAVGLADEGDSGQREAVLEKDGLEAIVSEMGREPGRLRYPYDLTVTDQNTIMVCEYENNRLQWFDKEGNSLGVWGGPGRDLGRLSAAWGATIGRDGLIYVVDALNSRIQIIRYRP